MKLGFIGSVFGLLAVIAACSGETKEGPQQVTPKAAGQRGESCMARNDCQEGLACISGVCSRNDFEIAVSAKHCDQVDCTSSQDCCGDKALEAPPECANRVNVCETPTLPGCLTTTCTSDASCGGGTCPMGTCATIGGACETSADCTDTCLSATSCSYSGLACTTDADCTTTFTCSTRYCNCTNPEYNPSDPICSDPACVDVCTLRCQDERCVVDSTCEVDTDCFAFGTTICDAGRCVDCIEDTDCNAANSEVCLDGVCKKPCLQNEECPLFHQCQGGECVETGCSSDRECVLAAGLNAGTSQEDARLSKCLPSDLDPTVNTCKVPCENDGACGSEFEVCDAGYCKFVGCETDEECRGYLGLVSEMVTPATPFVPRAVCRE